MGKQGKVAQFHGHAIHADNSWSIRALAVVLLQPVNCNHLGNVPEDWSGSPCLSLCASYPLPF